MARKQLLTNDNILTDIKNILKRPANLSHAEHHRSNIPYFVFSALVLAATLIFQSHYKLVLLLAILVIVIYLVVDFLRKKNSIKNASFDDYEIKKEVVSYVKEETYITDHSASRMREKLSEIRVFIMYFENGQSWNIPKDNYTWSKEAPMSDNMLYQLTHRGDLFTVVTKKATGEIVVAYPTEYFEYKNGGQA